MIVSGKLSDGASLGRESDLVERFGVSRPSLREALRILEAEGLVSGRARRAGRRRRPPARRAHHRAERRARAPVPQRDAGRRSRGAQHHRTGRGARCSRPARDRRAAAAELRRLHRRAAGGDRRSRARSARRTPTSTSASSSLAGNQTLEIVAEMLNEIVERAVTAVSQSSSANESLADPSPRASVRRNASSS